MATILIVDDDILSREFLSALLHNAGHRIVQASDGIQGLKAVHDELPDLVITDILMPHMDGYEFVSRLHADANLPDIPIIFYTANYREREATTLAVACHVRWVLSKPSKPELILNKVQHALGLPHVKANCSHLTPPASEIHRLASIDNQVNGYLFELGATTQHLSKLATGSDTDVLQMSQNIDKSLASLQAVSLRLTALIDMGIQLAAERDDISLIETGCKVAQNICVAKYAVLGVLSDDGKSLIHFATRGLDDSSQASFERPEPYQGVLGAILRKRESVRLAQINGGPQTLGLGRSHPPVHSFLGVPILSKSKVYGWLYLVDKLGSPEFDDVDERVATTLSAQFAIAYENLILLDELKRNHNRLQIEMAARVRGDDELRRFRTAMDASTDAILLIDRSAMLVVDINDTACQMIGAHRDEILVLRRENIGESVAEHLLIFFNLIVAYQGVVGTSEVELKRKDGTRFPVEVVRRVVQSENSWLIVTVVRDITARKESEQRLLQLAHYDPLTGLPNRMLFYNTLTHALKQATDHQLQIAVLFIDLDHFKKINDTLGHPIGDELLKQFALRILACVRVRDTIGRIGGDEFAVILSIPEGQQIAAIIATKIQDALHKPFDLRGHEVSIAVSIGITIFPDDAADPETLIKFADTAMYQAKESGRDTYRFFTRDMNTQAQKRLDLENALRTALDNDEFVLYFQPQVSIATGKIVGVEALIRWMRPNFGMVLPINFLPVLEETGLIVRLGAWVMRTACQQIKMWMRRLPRPVPVSINLSGKQFLDSQLGSGVLSALQHANIPAGLLHVELTENVLMSHVSKTVALLDYLTKLGVQIAIDDFGTGYSNLAYLKRFPIHKLKIDVAFIRAVSNNPDDAAIAKAIIDMAHNLNLSVIAEGVETEAQLAFLRENLCDEIQGFYFSCPVPPEDIEKMILAEKTLPTFSLIEQ